ncbi:interleukin-1 receptor-like 1 [Scleropages formosus]|nr:interleukin-1 receptor-like 1 [Scleropages formosus]
MESIGCSSRMRPELMFLSSRTMGMFGVTTGLHTKRTPCGHREEDPLFVTEGEALRVPLLPDNYGDGEESPAEYVWLKGESQEIGTSEDERVHHHGGQLYFLPLVFSDSGVYRSSLLRWSCIPHGLLLLLTARTSVRPSGLPTQDFGHIPNESAETVLILNASKRDEGIYTCRCTWEHAGRIFNSSASRKLIVKDPSATYRPVIRAPLNHTSETAPPGSQVKLACSVFFGFNVQDLCVVSWLVNGSQVQDLIEEANGSADCGHSGYVEENARNTERNQVVYKATLTICKVSEKHFHTEFKCVAMNSNKWDCVFVSLKNPEMMSTHVVINLTLLGFFILALVTSKVFMIDLVLFARDVLKTCHSQEDGKAYDAFVVYQTHNTEKAEAEKICHFVAKVLPRELEQKCGYRLFILGRDDLPGEDHMELVWTRVRLSRRLMIILTPGAKGECGGSISEAYGAPTGLALHQALVHDDLKVILITMERTGQLDRLPRELQHLVRKSAPLLWKEQGCGSRRFWKHVRYLMPPGAMSSHPESIRSLLSQTDI